MSDKVFIDSNIIVYAYDSREPKKQSIAQAILSSAIKNESAILSVQVLGEFFVVVTRKIKCPLSVDEAEKIVNILSNLPVAEIDSDLVKLAIKTQKKYGISYWDALITATANRTGCTKIISEDLNEGQVYNYVTVENPFK